MKLHKYLSEWCMVYTMYCGTYFLCLLARRDVHFLDGNYFIVKDVSCLGKRGRGEGEMERVGERGKEIRGMEREGERD